MADGEDIQPLVCDNGTGMVKAGFAGDDAPDRGCRSSTTCKIFSLVDLCGCSCCRRGDVAHEIWPFLVEWGHTTLLMACSRVTTLVQTWRPSEVHGSDMLLTATTQPQQEITSLALVPMVSL